MSFPPRDFICYLLISFALAHQTLAQDTQQGIEFFEKKVRPLLAERCFECHSNRAEKKLGGNLFLDSRPGWQKGGDLGPAIIPGKTDESLLIQAVLRIDDLEMPPGNRLSKQEINILKRWIEMGAPDPRESNAPSKKSTIDIEEGRKYWAFQQIREPKLPIVKNENWAANEIDFLVLAKLEQQKLKPVDPAEKRILIRRATFGLTGLPPTQAELNDFLNDDSENAFETVVDRLLASKHYGEHWGRHWLDVARYADSNGLDENIAHGNAWRYRDYVIKSFNADKPFDKFLIEQLAGDLLPPSTDRTVRHDRQIATGFLSLGPKVLAEVDETKMEMDIIDEQVETVGRAFMGLTLGCARCHDHKFDPIRTRDYYALAGIFKSTRTMEHFKKIARWNEVAIPSREQQEAHDNASQEIKKIQSEIQANEQLLAKLGDEAKPPVAPEKEHLSGTRKELKRLRAKLKASQDAVPELPTAMGVVDNQEIVDVRVHIRGSHLTQGDIVSRGFPAVLVNHKLKYEIGSGESGRLQLAHWLVKESPLTARTMVNRIWRWHFGRGIVETTDNLGQLGARPSNQKLLDWLANEFVNNGWSIKKLHRKIMLSRTYQMSSAFDERNLQRDPENIYLWRFPIQRLQAESIRDAMLSVSGLLDKEMGGSMLHVKNREFIFNHTSQDQTKYDSTRRSVYLPVIRNHLYDVFSIFDYADASVINSNRATTTVAPQALFMMNSDLVHDSAEALAKRIMASSNEFDSRLKNAYEICYSRQPTMEDITTDKKYYDLLQQKAKLTNQTKLHSSPNSIEQSPDQQAWQSLCHVLLSTNEFIFIR